MWKQNNFILRNSFAAEHGICEQVQILMGYIGLCLAEVRYSSGKNLIEENHGTLLTEEVFKIRSYHAWFQQQQREVSRFSFSASTKNVFHETTMGWLQQPKGIIRVASMIFEGLGICNNDCDWWPWQLGLTA